MGTKRVKELTEHELGLLIYHLTTGHSLNKSKIIYCHKNFKSIRKESSKFIADIIFNNKEVRI